jgi:PAS domain S-box-containing protein
VQERSEAFRISETLRDINAVLVDAGERGELETAVCETIADAEPYVFAWFGEFDAEDGEVVPRTSAGLADGYLDDLTISVHADSERNGPTASAVRTGRIQVVQDIQNDPAYETWRAAATERGYESSAAVPVRYDGTDYGVLNVYSDRPGAFGPDERALFADLGDTIANALDGIDARNRLQRQKEAYEQLTSRVADGFYAVDDDWEITYWNDRMAERTGATAAEVVGDPLWDAFPEIADLEVGERYRQAMATGEPESFETFVTGPFEYWVEIDVYPDENGLSIFSRRIDERKEDERQLAAIIENTNNSIYLKDRDGTYQMVNDAAARLFGLAPAEVEGKTDEDLFDPESAAAVRAIDGEIIETGRPDTRETVRYIDGREHVFIDNKFPYRDAAGNIVGIMGVSHDITGRKARERDLRATKQRLDLALEGTETGVWERTLDTGEMRWDETTGRLLGMESGSVTAHEEFLQRVHPDDRDAIAEAREAAIAGDGRYEAEFRIERDDGDERWVHAQGQLQGSDATRMVGIVTDITERKAYERRLEDQNEKLELLNRIVRHDIRNDMQIVTGFAEIVAEGATGETAEYADRIQTHSGHVVELTRIARDLMETVLGGESSRDPTALAPVLETEVDDVRGDNPAATVEIDGTLPRVAVCADELLSSVFRNLLKNAVQHAAHDDPTVRVTVTEDDDEVSVHVADDGPGVPDERRREIFGKGEKGLESEGTGIGLYLVSTLVEGYGGRVRVDDAERWADDEALDGAVFHVTLEKAD